MICLRYRTYLVSFLLKIDCSEGANIKQLNFKIGVSEIFIDITIKPRKIKACGYSQRSQMGSIQIRVLLSLGGWGGKSQKLDVKKNFG
jgi:hypothetical protein